MCFCCYSLFKWTSFLTFLIVLPSNIDFDHFCGNHHESLSFPFDLFLFFLILEMVFREFVITWVLSSWFVQQLGFMDDLSEQQLLAIFCWIYLQGSYFDFPFLLLLFSFLLIIVQRLRKIGNDNGNLGFSFCIKIEDELASQQSALQ